MVKKQSLENSGTTIAEWDLALHNYLCVFLFGCHLFCLILHCCQIEVKAQLRPVLCGIISVLALQTSQWVTKLSISILKSFLGCIAAQRAFSHVPKERQTVQSQGVSFCLQFINITQTISPQNCTGLQNAVCASNSLDHVSCRKELEVHLSCR